MEYRLIDTKDEAVRILDRFASTEKPTFCDIETEKLYIGVRLVQVYQVGTPVYLIDIDAVTLHLVKSKLAKLHTVWYNASYDLGTLNMWTEKVDDLYYLVKSAYPHFMEFSLDKVLAKLKLDFYEGIDKKAMQKKGFVKGAYLSQEQLKYASIDVYALAKIWEMPIIQSTRQILAYKVDMLAMKYAIEYQQNGLIVDHTKRLEMLKEVNERIKHFTALLPEGLNVNSPKQVKEFLGTEKSDKPTLMAYAFSNKPNAEVGTYILELRKAKKQAKYLESLAYDKMYTKFNVAGAISGRFTASGGDLENGFNAQQIPRLFQPLFTQPTEDTEVVSEDYSTLELRLACAIFNEPVMYRQFKEGKDLHTEMALAITGKQLPPHGKPLDKEEDDPVYITNLDRTKAKSVNFGYVFGMSASTYKAYAFTNFGIKLTLEEATKIRNAYFAKYPSIARYHKYIWANYKTIIVETALGRRMKPRLGTDGINLPVQGTGAETTKLAVHYLVSEHPDALKYIFNVVHDAIYLRVPKGSGKLWRERLQQAMLKGWKEISKTELFHFKDIPMEF